MRLKSQLNRLTKTDKDKGGIEVFITLAVVEFVGPFAMGGEKFEFGESLVFRGSKNSLRVERRLQFVRLILRDNDRMMRRTHHSGRR